MYVKLCCILFYSELNLAVAAHVSDKILDEVIDRLSKNHKTLVSIYSRTSMVRTPLESRKYVLDKGGVVGWCDGAG